MPWLSKSLESIFPTSSLDEWNVAHKHMGPDEGNELLIALGRDPEAEASGAVGQLLKLLKRHGSEMISVDASLNSELP